MQLPDFLPKAITNMLRIRKYLSLGILVIEPDCILKGVEIKMRGFSKMYIGRGCHIVNTKVELINATVVLGTKCTLSDLSIKSGGLKIEASRVELYEDSILEKYDLLIDGTMSVGRGSHINSGRRNRIVIREGGLLSLGIFSSVTDTEFIVLEKGIIETGAYFGVGGGSELRAATSIDIGDYVMLSYGVTVFDNNTHSTDWRIRRREILASRGQDDIQFCAEACKIVIGSDTWIGKNATILKGVKLGQKSIVGTGAVVGGEEYPDNSIIVNPRLRVIPSSSQDMREDV